MQSTIAVARFSGTYRRHGCNWTVRQGNLLACDSMGNVWGFTRKKEAEDCLSNNQPEFWIEEFETPGQVREVQASQPAAPEETK